MEAVAPLLPPSLMKLVKYEKINLKKEYKVPFNGCVEKSKIMHDFKVINIETILSLDVYKNGKAMKAMKPKNGKAAGADGVLPEFVKHLGPKKKMVCQTFLTCQKHRQSILSMM